MHGSSKPRLLVPAFLLVAACGSSASPDAGTAPVAAPPPALPATAAAPAQPGAKASKAGTAARPALQVRFDKITVKRGADKPIVRRGVQPHMSEVRACYKNGLGRHPNLHGQAEVALAIRKNGRVAAARLRSTNMADRATANCVVRAARRWSFRGATKRIDAVVRFKFYRPD